MQHEKQKTENEELESSGSSRDEYGRLCSFEGLADSEVRGVAGGGDLGSLDGLAYGAARFVDVGAIPEPAIDGEPGEFGEVEVKFVGRDVPQSHLFSARRVDDADVALEMVELGRRGGVPALPRARTDLLRSDFMRRVHSVYQ